MNAPGWQWRSGGGSGRGNGRRQAPGRGAPLAIRGPLPTVTGSFAGYGLALLGVAVMTLIIAAVRTRLQVPNISILYLLVILGLASTVGRGPALLAALLSFLTFNFLFVAPIYTLAVGEPGEWLALLIFLLTALITGHLTASLRARAEESRRREQVAATQDVPAPSGLNSS